MQQLPNMFKFGLKKVMILYAWLAFMLRDWQPIKLCKTMLLLSFGRYPYVGNLRPNVKRMDRHAPATEEAHFTDDVIIYSPSVTEFANAM